MFSSFITIDMMKSVIRMCIVKFGNPFTSAGKKCIEQTKANKINKALKRCMSNRALKKNVFFEFSKIADNEPNRIGAYVEFGIFIASCQISKTPSSIIPMPLKTLIDIRSSKMGIIIFRGAISKIIGHKK
ncbi:hypothetical protein KUL156_11150 [Alteromonas sp. KUL156]|nr:hypothetical protein KUL154_43310 [Alteromonas sp. KUL154]GFD98522.1 hypothetical protein KUL156_11150 [Alteromonas sp. KUL156]